MNQIVSTASDLSLSGEVAADNPPVTGLARLLLVEDDEIQRTSIASQLRCSGHEVVACDSSEQALEWLSRDSFDLIVTDLRLPGDSGIELVRRVRAIDPSQCVIVITVFADTRSVVEAMRAGAVDFLAKPFAAAELTASVDRALGYRSIIRSNESLRLQLEERFQQLQEINEQLNEFAGRVAHDLRSPVRATRLWIEFAREAIDQNDADGARKFMDSALRSIGSGTNIIDGLLALSKSSLLDLKPEQFSLEPLIRSTVESCRLEFRPREFDVNVEVVGTVCADAVLIGIAVGNLIHNAFKYSSSREHPRIHIVAGRFPAGHWSVAVSDNGIGIEPAQQDRLFKPFSRLDAAREFSGEGIGLTTVRRVMDKHHGQVTIASVPGEGTTVTLTVPISTGTEASG